MRQIESTIPYAFLIECLFAGAVVTMGIFVGMPWVTVAAVIVLFVISASLALHQRIVKWELLLAWACTLSAWGGLLLGDAWVLTLDNYYAAILLAIGIGLLFAGGQLAAGRLKSYWQAQGFTWAFLAGFLWLFMAYSYNFKPEFYVGLGIMAGVLVAAKFCFRLPGLVIQAVNTVLLLMVGLPVADAITRPDYNISYDAREGKRFYSYEFARKNPDAFAHWWNHFVDEWRVLQKDICEPDTVGRAPFQFRPGTEGKMFQSRVRINNLGFRGPDIPTDKGDAYRIVTIGESTTFGHTINASDVPWPRLLERLIREQLKPERPVQVINAGVPSYTARLNAERLAKVVLPLEPDMIISYHGYNGFLWLSPAVPPSHGKGPPPYAERPLKLLADCEYRLKMMIYRRQWLARPVSREHIPINPMQTEYARAYQDLFQAAQTNGIHLVLANYSMAVNAESEPDLVNFYRGPFPHVLAQIKANEVHSHIVAELAREHPEIRLVNTHPGLDGEHEKFIDLVHFTQEGREQMADTMFQAIEPVLRLDLNRSSATTIE